MLDKLLEKDIRRDQSRLLQSFRFFVANQFFIGHNKATELVFPDRDVPAIDIKQKLKAEVEAQLVSDNEESAEIEEDAEEDEPYSRAAPGSLLPGDFDDNGGEEPEGKDAGTEYPPSTGRVLLFKLLLDKA